MLMEADIFLARRMTESVDGGRYFLGTLCPFSSKARLGDNSRFPSSEGYSVSPASSASVRGRGSTIRPLSESV